MNTAQKLDSSADTTRHSAVYTRSKNASKIKIYSSVLLCSVLLCSVLFSSVLFCSVVFCSGWAKRNNLTFISIDIFLLLLQYVSHWEEWITAAAVPSIYLAVWVIAWGERSVWGEYIFILLPACVSSRDGDEWRGAKRQCCGSWWYRDCVWLGFAFTVVLFCLSKGQRRQLNCPTRHPPYQEGLHAGDWLWGARGLVGYLKRSQWI